MGKLEKKERKKEKKRKKCLNASKVGVRQRRRNECLYGWKRWGDLSQLCSLLTETVPPKRIFNSMRTTPQRKREKMHCSSSRVVLLSRPGNVWRFLSLHLLFHLRLIPLGIANYHSPRLRERERERKRMMINPSLPTELTSRLLYSIPSGYFIYFQFIHTHSLLIPFSSASGHRDDDDVKYSFVSLRNKIKLHLTFWIRIQRGKGIYCRGLYRLIQ